MKKINEVPCFLRKINEVPFFFEENQRGALFLKKINEVPCFLVLVKRRAWSFFWKESACKPFISCEIFFGVLSG